MKKFKDLCTELAISQEYRDEASLKRLALWCQTEISKDAVLTEGTHLAQFRHYRALATRYLEGFLPHVSRELFESVSAFEGLNAIQYAAKHGYSQFLLNAENITRQELNGVDGFGMTPLHLAASYGQVEVVSALLKLHANPKLANHQGELPLRRALLLPISHTPKMKADKEAIFNLLMTAAGDTLLHQDSSGETVCHAMASSGWLSLLKEVLNKDVSLAYICNHAIRYPIHVAIINQQHEVVQHLLTLSGVSTLVDGKERTSLHYAAKYGDVRMIELCYRRTPSLLTTKDGQGDTPLFIAAEAQTCEALQALIRLGCDPLSLDAYGNNVLHRVLKSGDTPDMVGWLLDKYPALMHQKNAEGFTPRDLYEHKPRQKREVMALLEEKGAPRMEVMSPRK